MKSHHLFKTCLCLWLLLHASLAQAAWFDDAWTFRKPVTVQSSQVSGTLANFPALIRFTDADLQANARADGFDIVFTTDDGQTQLDHEIERYDSATGELIAWVRLPTVSDAADTELFVYFGNSAASNQQNPASVWNSQYRMVHHLQESGGPNTPLLDATANANNGTVAGTFSNHPTYLANEVINGAREHPGNISGGGCTNCTTTVVNGDVVHTWTAGNGNFTVPAGVTSVRYLVVGGGGGGGGITDVNAGGAGGGGAGGFRTGNLGVTPGNNLSATVGSGGQGAACTGGSCTAGANGGSSTFASITASGGGRGGYVGTNTGADGGSGGGGRLGAAGGSGNVPSTTPAQGNAGGDGDGATAATAGAGGGGGSSAAGNDGTGNTGAAGGAGTSSNITGTALAYAGGGGAGGYFGATPAGAAGAGAARGGSAPGGRGAGGNAQANSGSGGGGASGSTGGAAFNGGNGGSGIVVVRYTPPRPSLNFPHSGSLSTTGAITAEAWAYIESGQPTPDHNPVFWKGNQIGWGANYNFRIAVKEGTNTMTWGVTCGGTEGYFEAGTPVYDQWAHYALTFDGTTTRAFINGQQQTPVVNAGGATACSGQARNITTNPVRSGYAPNREFIGQETFLRGRTDELRISATARPANWLLTQHTMIDDPASFVVIGTLEAQPPELDVTRTVDTPNPVSGDIVEHTIEVTNTSAATSDNVVLTESLGRFTTFVIDAYGAGQHFEFEEDATNPSGLTLGNTFYSTDGTTFDPIPGPAGWDQDLTHWRVEMNGEMNANGVFRLRYQVEVD